MLRVLKLLLVCQTLSGGTAAAPSPVAQIRNGTVRGRYLPEFEQDLFLGIPFAQAPRLDNPRPNNAWPGPLEADKYGATCYGFGSNQLLNLTQSEDCLNLNVVRPAGITADVSLPVLFWMYGGGWRQGSSADPMWNLSYVVQTSVENNQPVIAVSINYRLSFLGFPCSNETLAAGVTNLGLKDQRIAMEWIQENIGAFGGDPKKVTVWGESAGSYSASFHLVAYGGKGGRDLFRSAILVSGFESTPLASPSRSQPGYDAIVKATNCSSADDTLACLRTAPLDAIYSAEDTTGVSWSPVVDGDFLRTYPLVELTSGNVAGVPIILGSDSDEGIFVVTLAGTVPNNTAQLGGLISALLPALPNSTVQQLLTAYPDGAPAPPFSLAPSFPWCEALTAATSLPCGVEYRREAAILGDYFSAAPRRFMASQWARLGLPAYSFRFDTDPTSIPIVNWIGLGPGFATHGSELAYEFRLPGGFTTPIDFYPPVKNVSTHLCLSKVIVSKWIAFAATGDPNAITRELPLDSPYSFFSLTLTHVAHLVYQRHKYLTGLGIAQIVIRQIWFSMLRTGRSTSTLSMTHTGLRVLGFGTTGPRCWNQTMEYLRYRQSMERRFLLKTVSAIQGHVTSRCKVS